LAAPNEVAEELGGKAKKEGMHIRRRKERTWRNFENGFCRKDIMSKGYGFLWQMKIVGSNDRYLSKKRNGIFIGIFNCEISYSSLFLFYRL
jgi:hypothetical protein